MRSKFLLTLEKEIRSNLKTFNNDELYAEYGIKVWSDGTVFDDVNVHTYPSVDNWLSVYLDDSEEDVEYIGANKGWFDD